ncbi:protein of unknown function [Aminobacter niigataensis]|nr:protein of unknown function [Aminobacter niigataensis]
MESCLAPTSVAPIVRLLLNSRVCGVSQTDRSMVRSPQERLSFRRRQEFASLIPLRQPQRC